MIRCSMLSIAAATCLLSVSAYGQVSGATPDATGGGIVTDGQPTGPVPPRIDPVSERSPIFRYAVLFVIAGAAIGVCVIPGKRTHED